MLFQRIESPGLAHFSYMIGDGNQAVVVDPRRDCDVYVERLMREGMRLTHILETHRNEDYVIGSTELAARTGATILHSSGGAFQYGYGEDIKDGDRITVGRLQLEALHTPGHAPGHMSYLLSTPSGTPWVLFSGDALFAGDVGRTDLAGPDFATANARVLYDSIFRRILPLGDGVILCPAHGAGSVCGAAIADRLWTTIGLERRLNPMLQVVDADEFAQRAAHVLDFPPYFRQMEKLNAEAPPILGALPIPPSLSVDEFRQATGQAQVLDTRSEVAFAPSHVPGALFVWAEGLSSWAGWFLTYDRPLLLVPSGNDASGVVRALIRLGYDRFAGVLAGGMTAWHTSGEPSRKINTMTVQEQCRRLDEGAEQWILDVRSLAEVKHVAIPGAHHIHLPHLPDNLDKVPRGRPIVVFCGSGLRSMIAASILQREGWDDLTVVLGGTAGWTSVSCPLISGGPEARQ